MSGASARLAAAVVGASLVLGAGRVAADVDLEAIARAEHETMRSRLCPPPGTPTMGIEEMTDTARQRMAPAQVFDDLYVLGMKTITAWALTTSEGIILFDAMLDHNVEETVVGSMRSLGLDPAEIRYVIVSHGHNDHFGGARHLQETYGARVVMSVADWDHMRAWPQIGSLAPFPRDDIAATDGYTITLGGTTVTLYVTPGHTPGTVSSVFPVRDGNDVHYVGYWGGVSMSFLPPEGLVEFMGSVDRFARIDGRVDVPLTNHPFADGTLVKLDALSQRERGDAHPFVEGNDGFKAWMSVIHDCAGEILERKVGG